MKLKFLFIILFVLSSVLVYAQGNKKKKSDTPEIKEYIVVVSGDSIFGNVYTLAGGTPRQNCFEKKIGVKKENGDKESFEPSEVKSFVKAQGGKPYFGEVHDVEGKKTVLYKEMEGKIIYYKTNTDGVSKGHGYTTKAVPNPSGGAVNVPSGGGRGVVFYLQKEGGKFIEDDKKNKEEIEALFSDCDAYKNEIKAVRKPDTSMKVFIYNNKCK